MTHLSRNFRVYKALSGERTLNICSDEDKQTRYQVKTQVFQASFGVSIHSIRLHLQKSHSIFSPIAEDR